MEYRFQNLLGAPYRGGSLVMHERELLSPVGNRVLQVNLTESTSSTLPFESLRQLQTLALSPDGVLLLAADVDGRSLLINRPRRALLHHFRFKHPVAAAKFSPDGQFIACAVGRLLQVWRTPGLVKAMAPMQLHRTYGQCHADITSIDWTPDSHWLAVASEDLSCRVFSLDPIEGYRPPLLAGHKDTPLGVFWAGSQMAAAAQLSDKPRPDLVTASRDGALFFWAYEKSAEAMQQEQAAAALAQQQQQQQQQQQAQHMVFDEAAEGPEAAEAADAAAGAVTPAKRSREEQRSDQQRGEESDDDEAPEEQPAKRTRAGHGDQAAVAAAVNGHAAQQHAVPLDGSLRFAHGRWQLKHKHFLNQRGAKVTCVDLHRGTGMLVVGLSNGIFDLFQLPECDNVHTLSVSRERLTAAVFSPAGDWVALGCAALGQLLVWEWRSETYVLRQQGHHYDVAAAAFSPDGAQVATGADDSKVKVWNLRSGFCFVTFAEHAAPVTAVAYTPSGSVVLSASLDGTVRAFDLVRYRNFRTMTSPTPAQFASLAVDPGGEVICAGCQDTFQVCVWSLRTGRLLDVLAGHEGPVNSLAFSPKQPLLVSGSWDKAVRTWDVYSGKGGVDVLQHTHEVLAVAVRPDGKQIASSTLDGQIHFWDALEGELQGTIEGRRDLAGGRLAGDRRAAGNSAAGRAFTSLAFSAAGDILLAGGGSKWVCLYDVEERVMLRRFQTSHNRSLDGVLDQLNSKDITDAGPLEAIDDDASDADEGMLPPAGPGGPAAARDLPGTGGRRRAAVQTRAVALSPTGRAWAAATTEGLLLFSTDQQLVFDPADLAQDVTPAAGHAALQRGDYVTAAQVALRLQEAPLLRHVLLSTPAVQVATVIKSIPTGRLSAVLEALSDQLGASAHLQFLLRWLEAICTYHGAALQDSTTSHTPRGGLQQKRQPVDIMIPLRAVQQVLNRVHTDLASACDSNMYTLDYLCSAGHLGFQPVIDEI